MRIMDTQQHRHQNLAALLSRFELAGILSATEQAALLRNVITPNKLTRMLFDSNMPCLVARGIEHVVGTGRGSFDHRIERARLDEAVGTFIEACGLKDAMRVEDVADAASEMEQRQRIA
jgi:hypothetical protein